MECEVSATPEPDDTFLPVGDRDPALGYRVHPTAALFPFMSDAELNELAEDIKANGLRDPVVTFKGVLLDGRNRLRACALAGIEASFTEWKRLDSATEIHKWIISKNLHRRHLTESQRAMVAGRLARRTRGGVSGSGPKSNSGIPPLPMTPTQAAAAEQLSVSVDSVKQAATVLSKGSPDLIAAVDAGEVAVSRAADIARAAPNNPEAQAEALAAPRTTPKPPPEADPAITPAKVRQILDEADRSGTRLDGQARLTALTDIPDPEPDTTDDEPEPPTGWAKCPCCGHRFDPYEEE